jgi:phospholipid/cholesterol/gamma-HCH transport system substrate-binding protein
VASQASKFKIGLFLIVGFLLLNGALLWIGASRILQPTQAYTTYFRESVQGLAVGSAVKYRGVPIGRVFDIRVAPDGRLVEVQMDIDSAFQVRPGMRASLAITGITGIAFIEVGYPKAGMEAPPLELSFPPPENYIPSQPSFLTNLLSALGNIAASVEATDLPALAEEIKGLAREGRKFLSGREATGTVDRISAAAGSVERMAGSFERLATDPRIGRVLDRAASALGHLDRVSESLERATAGPRLEETLADARAAAKDLRGLAETLRSQASELRTGERLDALQADLPEATQQAAGAFQGAGQGAATVLEGADGAVRHFDSMLDDLNGSLNRALERLTSAVDRIEGLAASLEANPSRLLLERPPEKDF